MNKRTYQLQRSEVTKDSLTWPTTWTKWKTLETGLTREIADELCSQSVSSIGYENHGMVRYQVRPSR
jgi:hypothetical protein